MTIDPFTFEIIRYKFMRIVDEAVTTLKHISGSSATTEGHDLVVGLYRADGSLLMAVVGYLHALPGAGEACRHIVREYAENPGIFEGDVFFLNDPYVAALHSSDDYVVSPIFYRGELVAWAANFVHLRDVGAINPGGFAPDSREIFHEGIMCPGIKLMEQGVLRKDVWKTLLNMVRIPEIVALDLHSQIAANITIKERLIELLDKYGPEAIDEVAQGIIDESETLLRRRLRELPDGTWRARQYLETGEKDYAVHLAMSKRGDALHFDFSGTSEQAPVGLNSTYWGTCGALLAPLFPVLGFDILWNDGFMKPITMFAPEGSLVNCRRPAPNCLSTITGITVVNNLSVEAVSKLLAASETYRKEATAVWQGAHTPVTISGFKDREYVVGILTQHFGGSGGARTFADGVDFGGTIANPTIRTPNIEAEELNLPVLYLFHRLLKDSAGPGRFRGGMTTERAITPTTDEVDLVLYGTGTEYPECQGLLGGYPGCNAGYVMYKGIDAYSLLRSADSLEKMGDLEASGENVVWGTFRLRKGELLHFWAMGGGGYDDPLERHPKGVENDVLEGLVSVGCAREIYGVVFSGNLKVNLEATSELRKQLLQSRRNGWGEDVVSKPLRVNSVPESSLPNALQRAEGSYSISENLQVLQTQRGSEIHCRNCHSLLSFLQVPWKEYAVFVRSPLTRSGPRRSTSGRFEMRQYLCPTCGRLLDVEVALPPDPRLDDEICFPTEE
ncbi:MAG: hydantoinase B/oxoprolinase family protein [Nitrospinota bacterium]